MFGARKDYRVIRADSLTQYRPGLMEGLQKPGTGQTCHPILPYMLVSLKSLKEHNILDNVTPESEA
jgi:hypothetical protein